MKRDMDLVREILLEVESWDNTRNRLKGDEKWPQAVVDFHVHLLIEAGLLEGTVSQELGNPLPRGEPSWITWAGYDFLEAIRPKDRWEKTKELAGQAGGVTFDVLKSTAVELAKTTIRTLVTGG